MIPREIQVEHWPERTIYDLPLRPLGPLRFVGLVPMLFAMVWLWMPGHQLLRSVRQALQGGGGFEWFFVGFLSLFVLAGLIPFCLGLFMVAGRTRLVVERDRLIVTELAGPIRRSRKVRFVDIERLEVMSRAVTPQGVPPIVNPLMRLGGAAAALKNGKKRLLLVAYPRDWVESLTEEVVGLMRQQGVEAAIAHVEAVSRTE